MYEDFTLEFDGDDDLLCFPNGRRMREEAIRRSILGTDTSLLLYSDIGYLSHGKHRIGVDSNLGNASLAIIRFSNGNIPSWNMYCFQSI